jgi:hypothetical protein
MKRTFNHLKKIFIHKWWVFYYSCKLGIPWQGITHDLSKFSLVELKESIKFYQGDKSPIPEAKKIQGYSEAWLHHKGRNKHHYEYWIDWKENGVRLLTPMPYKYVLEMIADYLGAYRAYNGSMSYTEEFEWWQKKRVHAQMHHITKQLVTNFLSDLSNYEEFDSGRISFWKDWYEKEIRK